MNQLSNGTAKRSKWGYALALLWLAACGGVIGKPHVGGESHFLRHCGDGCGSGLECVADVCTRGCRVNGGSCADLAANAACTNTSLEPGALAICDVACKASTDCRALGADFECASGYCRGPAPTPPGSGGSGGSSSNTAGSGAADVCELPFVSGPCEAAIPVFAFEDGECVAKTYGGCEGNGNRFYTLEACQTRCAVPGVPAARCLASLGVEPCDAALRKYSFQDGQCVTIQYGGCGPRDNVFDTLEQCLTLCEGRPDVAACPEGRTEQEICLECGPAGGCSLTKVACAKPCEALGSGECGDGLSCVDGFCQVGPCI